MANNFSIIPADVLEQIQMNAGILLSAYNPTTPFAEIDDSMIIAVTTGGINAVCNVQSTDLLEDVDNAPNNTMEGRIITGYECTMSFTSIKFNAENAAWALGSATTTTLSGGAKKIVPKIDVAQTDYKDIWWVCDKTNGGAWAVLLKNAMSTGGLNMQSTKNGKGTNQVTLTGFYSAANIKDVPMEFYDIPAPGGSVTGGIELTQHSLTLEEGKTAQLGVSTYPVDAEVTWSTSAASVATVANGTVTAVGEGDCIITAQITVDGVEFTDTCTVVVTAEE